MRRLLALLAFLTLSGCSSLPAPDQAPYGAADPGTAPTEGPSESPETATEIRQSRPGQSASADEDAVWWNGATWGGLCVEVPVGCAGMTEWGEYERRIRVGRAATVRLTITWDAVDPKTEQLRVTAAGAQATGPSPLVLDVEADGDFTVRVESIGDGPVVDRPSQPFEGLAEFG